MFEILKKLFSSWKKVPWFPWQVSVRPDAEQQAHVDVEQSEMVLRAENTQDDELKSDLESFDRIVSGIRNGDNVYYLAQIMMLNASIFIKPLSETFGNILHESVACCNEAAIKFLVTGQSIIPNYVNIPGLGGQTPLCEAVRIRNYTRCRRVVLFLLKNGADTYVHDGGGSGRFDQFCRSDAPIRKDIRLWLDELAEIGTITEDISNFGSLPPITN